MDGLTTDIDGRQARRRQDRHTALGTAHKMTKEGRFSSPGPPGDKGVLFGRLHQGKRLLEFVGQFNFFWLGCRAKERAVLHGLEIVYAIYSGIGSRPANTSRAY